MKSIGKALVPNCVMGITLTPFKGAFQDTGQVQLHGGFGCVSYVKLVEKYSISLIWLNQSKIGKLIS